MCQLGEIFKSENIWEQAGAVPSSAKPKDMDESWKKNEQIYEQLLNRSWASNKFWLSHEQVVTKSWTTFEKIMKKSWTSHVQ